ncbi:MAG TPA: hypothetical protein VHX11_04435 [Acidobacteriaceae bacterium]|jgi:hypothetical protein|nr:hypothetical protein [Acidobacteriaceae bacterium]
MTKQDLLRIIIRQARTNGFEFRKWFQQRLEQPWINFDSAVNLLAEGRCYYTLLFSHDFVRCFWKQGAQISFVVPSGSYTRRDKEGRIVTVYRKAFTRRTVKADVWKYHLREMAAQEEPLRYIRRFLMIEEDLQPTVHPERAETVPHPDSVAY